MMRQMTTDPARATTPRRPRLWRGMLALALVLACLAAAYLSFAVWSYIRNLDTAQQDHAEWVLSQLEVEYLKLDRALDHAIDLAPAATAAAAAGTGAGTGTGPDAAALEELRKRFEDAHGKMSQVEPTLKDAINTAAKGVGRDDLICVTGSFVLAGEAKALLRAKQEEAAGAGS